jgi:hypothetical protein
MAERLDPAFDPTAAFNAGADYYGPRWSFHYGRPPDPRWLESPEVEQVFLEMANNPAIDPGATLAQWEQAYIAEAARLGIRSDAGGANNIMQYARLRAGVISWQQIGSQGTSTTPTGAGALEAPLVDVIAAREQAAIDQLRSSGGEWDSTDANILAFLQSVGADFDSGLTRDLALSPVPAPELRVPQAMMQGSVPVASPYSGLSSFNGFGVTGSFGSMPPVQQTSRGGFTISPLILLAAAGVAAYFIMRKS